MLELYRKGISREMIVALYEFIGVIMALPQVKDEELIEEIKQTTEEKQMSLLNIAEQVGVKKGIAQQKAQGLKEAISDILEIKFGVVGLELFEPVEQVTDIADLQKIRAGLKQARSVAEAEALIRTYAKERSENGPRN